MDIDSLVKNSFAESIDAINKSVALTSIVSATIKLIASTFINKNKLLICGNGGSAADAQHFAAEFVGRFEKERSPLPAISLTTDTSALTAISNDYSFNEIFSKQVSALGNKNDILFAISTSGNSENVIKAIEIAQKKDMIIISLTGKDGGKIKNMMRADKDINLNVNFNRTARIQEVHIIILHTICDGVDNIFLDRMNNYA